jgi:hypothetical protein
MNPADHIAARRHTARRLLPGFREARAQLDIAVHVLEYAAQHLEGEFTADTLAAFKPPNRDLLKEIEALRGLLDMFCRVYGPPQK